jgi:hypothetical protein
VFSWYQISGFSTIGFTGIKVEKEKTNQNVWARIFAQKVIKDG